MQSVGFAITVRNHEERSINASVMGSDANACAFIQISDASMRLFEKCMVLISIQILLLHQLRL